MGLELGLKVAKKRCYCLLSRAKRLQSRSLNDALVKSESGHVFLFKTAKDDNKDPKIQKGDNHHSRVRFSFHFHYLKTKNPDREKIDVKLKNGANESRDQISHEPEPKNATVVSKNNSTQYNCGGALPL